MCVILIGLVVKVEYGGVRRMVNKWKWNLIEEIAIEAQSRM